MKVKLLNGMIIESIDKYNFPPLKDMIEIKYACEICPLRPLCHDNNEFDCQVYGMFSGFYLRAIDALKFIKNQKNLDR